MSVKETSLLRKSGKLVEAFHMASTELKENPTDAWIQMSMFWVLRDLCLKVYIPQHDDVKLQKALDWMRRLLPTMMDESGIGEKAYQSLVRNSCKYATEVAHASELSKTNPEEAFNNIRNLITQSSSVDVMLHESLGWILYRYLKKVPSSLSSDTMGGLLKEYMSFKNERPSMLHSSILNYSLAFSKNHTDFDFCRFLEEWGLTNFRSEDFMGGEVEGHTYQSLVSRVCRWLVESNRHDCVKDFLDAATSHKTQVLDFVRESYFWHFMNMHKEGKMHEMFELMAVYADLFSPYGPSHWHSEILKLAERFMVDQDITRFVFFFKAWNVVNLRAEDWLENTDEKGNTYKSLAVKSAKKCFDVLKNQQSKNKELVKWLLSLYEIVIKKNDKDDWGIRNYALLHIWLGDFDKATSIYRDLLLTMSEKFYIWSELAACITNDIPLKTALLCKALLVERDEKFLGEIHLHLAELLIAQGQAEEAQRELSIYRVNREKESWPLSPLYHKLVSQVGEAEDTDINHSAFYRTLIPMAEEFAFAELENRTFVLVDKISKDGKTRCVFVDGNGHSFQVNARRFEGVNKARFGTAYDVKCIEETTETNFSGIGKSPRLKPVVMHLKEGELWASFPLNYGYISYVNTEKKIITVLTPDSSTVLHPYTDRETYRKGDFLAFRQYETEFKGEKKCHMAGIHRCKPSDALECFPSALVVVDSVNSAKSLFHYVSDVRGVDGVVFFNDTSLRPKEGQLLRISYCFRMDKEHKRRCEVVRISRTEETSTSLVRQVTGELTINSSYKGSYGFVEDCYVPGFMLKENTCFEGDEVTVLAVYSGDGKWKVIRWL